MIFSKNTIKDAARLAMARWYIEDAGMYSFIIDAANIIMEKEYKDNYSTSDDADFLKKKTYELYFYSGAMVNVFLQWQKNGKNITPEELAGIITDYRRIS